MRVIRWKEKLACVAASVVLVKTGYALQTQEQLDAADSRKLLAAGIEFHKAVEKATSASEAADNLQKAIERYSEAARLKPDFYPAHAMWGRALSHLARTTSDPRQYKELITAARERYAVAVRCPGVDWVAYYDLGVLLTEGVYALANDVEGRRAVLREAIQAYEKGLELASFTGERGRIERQMGECFVQLAQNSADLKERRDFYRKAVVKFESATKAAAEARSAHLHAMWGVALLQLAKPDNGRVTVRQAIERLQTAAELEPTDMQTQYNLACAYALLDQPARALEYLGKCLANDPQGVYRKSAAIDPDLAALRAPTESRQILERQPTRPSVAPKPPPLSNR